MKSYDLIVIGGGSAGIAAAIAAYENGVRDILILEREKELGGILLQCIHNGFGLHMFKREMTGPAYAQEWIGKLETLSVEYRLGTMVTGITEERIVSYANAQEGYIQVKARAVILAMGCRERTRGAIGIPGYRPAGIWTAGTAQRYLNLDGYMVGRRVFILGSGDIGLIMARRMVLEGAVVEGVAELMPYSGGLPRNIKQCLEDFDIPLFLSYTVVDLKGKKRLEEVVIAQVDEQRRPIPGTEKVFAADTLLLSVGLIPENALGEDAGIALHPKTGGALVNESYETSVPGIFACGNVLHVHDLVDFVSQEGEKAGKAAASYINGVLHTGVTIEVCSGDGVQYILPHRVNPQNIDGSCEFLFRCAKPYRDVELGIYLDGKLWKKQKKRHLAPAEMEKVTIPRSVLEGAQSTLLVKVETEGEEASINE